MIPTPLLPICVAGLISAICIDTSTPAKRNSDVRPQQNQWCRVTSSPEQVGVLGTRKRCYLGRVASLDDHTIELHDVVEDEWTIQGPVAWRKLPYLSRLTSCESSIRILGSCRLSDDRILAIECLADSEAAQDRCSIIEEGGKLVRVRIGIVIEDDIEAEEPETDE